MPNPDELKIPTDIFDDEQPEAEAPANNFADLLGGSSYRGAPKLKDWYRTALGKRPGTWKYSPAFTALNAIEEEAKNTKTLYPYPRWNTQAASGYPAPELAGGGGSGSVQNLDSYIDYAGIKLSMRANEELFGDWDYLDPPKDPVSGKLLGKMGQPLPERASGWHPNGEEGYYGTGWDAPWLRMQDRIDTARQAGLDALAAIEAEKEQPGYVEPAGWEKFWQGANNNIESKVMFAAGLGVVGMITDYTLQIGKITEKWIGEERFYSQLLAAEGEPLLWQKGEAEGIKEVEPGQKGAGLARELVSGEERAFVNEHGYAPPSTVENQFKDHWLLDFVDSINLKKYAGNSIIALAKIAKGDIKLSELKDFRQRSSDLANMQYSVAYQDWDAIREFEERVAAGENVDMVALSLEQKWSEFAGRASINPINIAMPALRKIQSEKEIADIFNYVNSPMSEVDDVFRVYGKTAYVKTAQGVADVGVGATVEGQQVLQYVGTLRTGAQPGLGASAVEGAFVGAPAASQTDAVLAAYTMGTERTLAGITTKATNFGPLYLTGTSKQFIAMTGAKQAAENLAQNLTNVDDIIDAYLNLAKLGSANALEQKTAYLMLDNMLKAPELMHTEGAVELSIALRGELVDADGLINPTKFLNKVEKYIQEGKDPTKAAISMAENYWKDTYPTVRQIIDAEDALKLDPDYVVPEKIQRFWDNGGKIKPFDRMVAMTTAERGLTGAYGAAHRFQKLVSSTVLVGMNFGVLTRGFVTDTLTIGAVQKGGLLHTGLNSAELGIDWLGYEHPGYMQGFGAGDKELAAIDAFAMATSKGKYSEMGSFLGAVLNLSEPGTFSSKILETITNPSGRGMVYVEQKSSQKIIGAAIDQASRSIIPKVVPDTSEIIASGTPEKVVNSIPQLIINKRGDVDEVERLVLKKLSNGESIRTKDTMDWMSPEDKTNLQRLGLLPAVEEIAAKDIPLGEALAEIDTLLQEARTLMRGIDQQFPAPQVDPLDPTSDIGQIMGDAAIAVDETVSGEAVLPQDIYDTAINRIQANTNVTDAIGKGLEEIKSYINKAVRISGASQEVINHTLDNVLAPVYAKMRDPRYEFRKITGESRDAMAISRDFSKRLLKVSDADLPELWLEVQASSLAVPGDVIPSNSQLARDKMWTFVFADYLDKFIQARRVAVAEFKVYVDVLYDVLPPSPIRESLKGLAPYTAVQEHEWVARGLDNAVIYEDKLYPVGRLIQQHVAIGDLANANRAIYSYMNPHVGLYRHNNEAFDREIINLVFGDTAELYSSIGEIEPEVVWDAMVSDRARNELPAIKDSYGDVVGDRPEIRVPEAVEVTNVLDRVKIKGGEIDLADEDALKEFALEYGEPVKYTEIIESAGSIEEQNLALAEYARELIGIRKTEISASDLDEMLAGAEDVVTEGSVTAEIVSGEELTYDELFDDLRDIDRVEPNLIDDIDPVIPPHDGSLAITEGRNLYEQRNILEATIRNIKSDLKKVWSETLPNMPKESLKAFKAYFKEWRKRMPYIKNAAHAFGQTQRDKILHAYAVRFGLDGALGMVRNFHFWPTRTMYQWAKRAPYYLDLLSAYLHYHEAMEKEHASWPDWLRQSWSTNEIFGLESENPLYLSLQGVLDIFQNLGGDAFLDEDRRATWFSTVVDQISSKVPGSMGMIQQLLMAIGLKARGEDEAAAKWAGRMIPVTRLGKGLTSIAGINEGRGIDLDPSIWAFSTNNDWDDLIEGRTLGPYDEKRVAVAMGHLLDKYPDMPEELLEQAKAHKGPLWDEAIAVVAKQGALGNIISMFTGISARARSKDDLIVAQFWQEYIFLMVQYDNLDAVAWREQLAKLMDKYPFAELMLLARKGTEERNISYGYSVLSRIPPGQTDNVSRAAGFDYDIISYFYDNKGDVTGLPQEDQDSLWTFFAEAGASIAIPDKATKGEWRNASAGYTEMMVEMEEIFGENILDKIDAGYNLKGESLNSQDAWYDYLEQFPEVREAMRWQSEYIIQHPTLSYYYASIDRLRNFWKGDMYQKLEDEFGVEIWDTQTEFFIYVNTGQTEKASAFKKAHPELQEYWDRKNDFYMPDITQAMADYGEKLPEGQDARVRADFDPATASSGAVKIADYIDSPKLKTYTLDEWVTILGKQGPQITELALRAWEFPDETDTKTEQYLRKVALIFDLTYEEFIISIGQAE